MAYSTAYWYHTRTNELIRVPDGWMHAEYVIKNQDKFGGLPDYILKTIEDDIDNRGDGSAADSEIYRFMAVKGWVRVHKYPNSIGFMVYQLDKKNREAIFDMVSKFCSKENDERVVIEPIISSIGDIRSTYASEILAGELFERSLPDTKRRNVSSVIWFNSKTGKVISSPSDHIFLLLNSPETFGLTKQQADKWGEGVNIEKIVIKNGWYRVHTYPSFMTIDLDKYDKRAKENIYDLIVELGVNRNSKITVRDIRDNYYIDLPAEEFTSGEIFESIIDEIKIKDKMFGDSYWYNPNKNKLIKSNDKEATHGSIVFEFPKEFGLTKEQYKLWYGDSGYELNDYLVKNGWFRIHTIRGEIHIVLNKWDDKIRQQVYDVLTVLSPANNDYVTIEVNTGRERSHHFKWKEAVDYLFESNKFLRLISEANIKTDKFSEWVPEARKALDFWLKRYKDEDQSSNFFGRYEVILRDVREGYSETVFSFTLRPKHGSKNVSTDGIFKRSQSFVYRTPSKAVEEVPPTVPGYAYRGMSFEEWNIIKKTGIIKSRGGYNIGNKQAGLTFFGDKSDTASIYANSFAPISYKTSRNRPGVVIEVPNEHLIKGGSKEVFDKYMITNSELVGEGELPASVINRAWMVVPVLAREGSLDVVKSNYSGKFSEGSWDHPSFKVVYVPIEDLP